MLFHAQRYQGRIDLETIENKTRRRLGLRLKWPLGRHEVAEALELLERYRSYFSLSLQIDQM